MFAEANLKAATMQKEVLQKIKSAIDIGDIETVTAVTATCPPDIISAPVDKDGNTLLHIACSHGSLHIVQHLVTQCKANPDCQNNKGETPLHHASKDGHLDMIEWLILEKCQVLADNRGNIALHLASKYGHLAVVRFLINISISCKCDTNCSNGEENTNLVDECKCDATATDKDGLTPLHLACLNGHLDVAKYLVDEIKCSAEIADLNENTPLHKASQNGHLDVVQYLISEKGCSPHCQNKNGITPFLTCCLSSGSLSTVKYLIIECKCDPKQINNRGSTALHFSSQGGQLELARYLVAECKCDATATNKDGLTPLHLACLNGHLDVAKYLVDEIKCSAEIADLNENTPLHKASQNGHGHLDVVQYLISEKGCSPHCQNKNGITPFLTCCLNSGSISTVKYLIIECKCDPKQINNRGSTALHFASQGGHLELARYLVAECKCDATATNKDGLTPLHLACLNGHLDVAKYLVDEIKCSAEIADLNENTPLHKASQNGHLDVVQYLISEKGCSPHCQNKNGITPFLTCCLNSGSLSTVKYLIIECKCDPKQSSNRGFTGLHCACQEGHLDLARYLVAECKCDATATNKDGLTPLYLACLNGHLDVAKYLVDELKCSAEIADLNENTPLHMASQNGHLDVVQYLISEKGCSPHCQNKNGITPFLTCCLNSGSISTVKYLIIECKCDPKQSSNRGFTGLHCACQEGHLDLARYLVAEYKCDATATNKDGLTPLYLACLNGHLDVAKYLVDELKCSAEIADLNENTPLHKASQNGHLDVVQYLISEKGCSPHCQNKIGNTPFLICCLSSGSLSIVKYLITECKCDPKQSSNRGFTGFHNACQEGHLELARYLVAECKCDATATNKDGLTPLHLACLNGHLDVAKYLVDELKCSAEIADLNENTPLHMASQNGHLDVVQYLISEKGCSPHCQHKYGDTPFLTCCLNSGSLSTVKYLITECKCDPKQSSNRGFTGLHCACQEGHLELARYLVAECKCDATATNKDGLTSLHLACLNGHLEVAQYLVDELKCSADVTDNDGNTPLHCASQNGQLHVVKYLIEKGNYNPNCENNFDMTPLLISCVGNEISVVKYLISKCNCDPTKRNKFGMTPLVVACVRGHKDLLSYLGCDLHCSLHTTDALGNTLLHNACSFSHTGIVKFLIERARLDPNSRNILGSTPLHASCFVGDLSTAQYLISNHNCDPMLRDSLGNNSLDMALFNGSNPDLVKYLIIKRCYSSESRIGADGNTGLHLACANNRLTSFSDAKKTVMPLIHDVKTQTKMQNMFDMVKSLQSYHQPLESFLNSVLFHDDNKDSTIRIIDLMIQEGCDPNATNSNGQTPFHVCCMNQENPDITQHLITNYGSDPNQKTKAGNTGLHYASQKGYLALVKHLVQVQKCDPSGKNNAGFTSLHFASQKGHLQIVKYLVGDFNWSTDIRKVAECKCDATATTNKGFTPLHLACLNGHIEVAKYIVDELKCSAERADLNENTPLHMASQNGHLDIVQYLTSEKGCSPHCQNKNSDTPFLTCCLWSGSLSIVKYLITECKCDPKQINNRGFTALHFASLEGHLELARYLVAECKCDATATDKDGITPLHLACLNGHLKIAQYLGQYFVSVQKYNCSLQTSVDGVTPLHLAAMRGHLGVVKYLVIDLHCSVHTRDTFGNTCLYAACQNTNIDTCIDIVKFLIEVAGMDPNCRNMVYMSSLHICCMFGNKCMAQYLINNHNCDPMLKDRLEQNALVKAIINASNLELVEYLLTICQSLQFDSNGITALHWAYCNMKYSITKVLGKSYIAKSFTELSSLDSLVKDVLQKLITSLSNFPQEVIKKFVDNYVLGNACDSEGVNLQIVDLLIRSGYDPHATDSEGQTPLHVCCSSQENPELVQHLITKCGCNPNQIDTDGNTGLHFASCEGFLRVVKCLIEEHRCDPALRNNNGVTPLHFACHSSHLELARYLVDDKHCSVDVTDNDGDTPLHWASDLRVVQYLTDCKRCDPHCHNTDGDTPFLSYCLDSGSLSVVKYFITECECDPNQRNNRGFTGVHNACKEGHLELARYLVAECKCDATAINKEGTTPLHLACLNGHLEVAKYLVDEHKCSADVTDNDGNTPLHFASWNGHLDIIKYLIGYGFDPNLPGKGGNTLLHYSCLSGYLEVTEFLINECMCDITTTNNDGSNLVHISSKEGHIRNIEFLTEMADTSLLKISDSAGKTPLMYAAECGHLSVVRHLVMIKGCDTHCKHADGLSVYNLAVDGCFRPDICAFIKFPSDNYCGDSCPSLYGCRELRIACHGGNIVLVKELIHQKGMRPQCTDKIGKNSLHYASEGGHLDIVKHFAMNNLCDAEATDSMNESALHYACSNGSLETVEYLTQHNDPKQFNSEGYNAMHLACIEGHADIVEYLIENQLCDLKSVDNKDRLGYHLACLHGHLSTLIYFINKLGSLPCNESMDGQNCLHFICIGGHAKMFEYVKGLNDPIALRNCIVSKDSKCNTPFHYACQSGNLKLVKMFMSISKCRPELCQNSASQYPHNQAWIKKHYDVVVHIVKEYKGDCDITDLKSIYGYNLGHHACEQGDLEFLKYLMEGALIDPLHPTLYGMSGLHFASLKGRENIVKFLAVRNRESVQIQDSSGNTPLHYACQSGNSLTLVEFLIRDCQCDIDIVNRSGDSPIHIATTYNHPDIVVYLLSMECNPLNENNRGDTPHAIANKIDPESSTARHYKYYFGAYKEHMVEKYIKVFIVGDHDTGKSTLFRSLQENSEGFKKLFYQLVNVSNVADNTSGVEQCMIDSHSFGKVHLYDFAGHEEYYTCNAAFLEFFTARVTGLFVILVDASQTINNIKESILRWVSFIEGSCSRPDQKRFPPHVIIVGSHYDKLSKHELNIKYQQIEDILNTFSTSLQTFLLPAGIVLLDCRKRASPEKDHLCNILCRSSEALRKGKFSLSSRLSEVYEYLLGKYGTELCHTSKEIVKTANGMFPPLEFEVTLQHLKKLSDAGVIFYFDDKATQINSWVVGIDESITLLREVTGSLFCPIKEKRFLQLNDTGIWPKSKIKERLHSPDNKFELIMTFLEYFQFCHRVNPNLMTTRYRYESDEDRDKEALNYFFPALLNEEVPGGKVPIIWQQGDIFDYRCGWCLACMAKGERVTYFTTRFLHDIILELALLYAEVYRSPQEGSFKRKCMIWKNGITWSQDGVVAHFELPEEKATKHRRSYAFLFMACVKTKEVECVKLRSELMQHIRSYHQKHSPHIPVQEFFLDPTELLAYPLESFEVQKLIFIVDIEDVAMKIQENAAKKGNVFFSAREGEVSSKLSDILFFEPYTKLSQTFIEELFNEEQAKEVSEQHINKLAKQFGNSWNNFLQEMFISKMEDIDTDILESSEKILQVWKEHSHQHTYKDLREALDRFSIFGGRSPLEMVNLSCNAKLILYNRKNNEIFALKISYFTTQGTKPKQDEDQEPVENGTTLDPNPNHGTADWYYILVYSYNNYNTYIYGLQLLPLVLLKSSSYTLTQG